MYSYNDIEKVPYNKTGLVLGTAKYLVKGGLNQYFINRIDAAAALYHHGKIDYIVVSGDNAHHNYNEPRAMRKELIKRNVPADKIYLDYAGFRTLDSVVRIHRIFKQKNVTIISQDFQNERAIFLAKHNGINAIGFNAKSVDNNLKAYIRELLARVKCILDIYVFNSKPKFLGDSINIGGYIDPKEAQMQSSEVINNVNTPGHATIKKEADPAQTNKNKTPKEKKNTEIN
jgi:SanA protein